MVIVIIYELLQVASSSVFIVIATYLINNRLKTIIY